MKELYLFVPTGRTDDALYALGDLGVVEVRNINVPCGDPINQVREKIERIEKAMVILDTVSESKLKHLPDRKKHQTGDAQRIVDSVLLSGEYKQKCQTALNDLKKELEWYNVWGKNLSLKDFPYLAEKGIYVRLYMADKKALKGLPQDKCIVTFPEVKGKTPVALFARNVSETLELREEKFPELSYQEIQKQIAKKERQLVETDQILLDMVEKKELLDDYLELNTDRLSFRNALYGMGDIEGAVNYLKGYVPVDSVEEVKAAAEKNKWGYLFQEPENYDEVPTKIKIPKFVSIINPVLEFVGVVPGYKEVDISLWFLIAFSLFFAMLVGDAGYGAIFLLLALVAGKKLPTKIKVLTLVLSLATIGWGAITGTYFGSKGIAEMPFFAQFVIPEVSSFGDSLVTVPFMMHLSFMIGAVHLTLAHLIRGFQFINSIKAVSQLGWVLLVWGLFFVVEQMVLKNPMPEWAPYLFYSGGALVALFSKEDKNFFKSILFSLAGLPLALINGFSDVVSYVRLFAVGMATAVVASSFNAMTLGDVKEFSVGVIFSCIGLLLGHLLNIVLALMAVMVHGIRLNMLEFAGHLNIEFTGDEFKPFKLKSKTN